MTEGRFVDRVALVTGAGSGIGQTTAEALAREGARVTASDLDLAAAERSAERIRRSGGRARAVPLDVTSESDWQRVLGDLDEEGPLALLVNNAGVAHVGTISDTSLADWRRVMAVNLDGVFLGTRAGLRAMRRQGEGCIVNVASASGIRMAAAGAAYCTSKAAVIALSRSAALECNDNGDRIRVNVVAPGGVKTAIWQTTPGLEGMADSDEWRAPSDAPAGRRFATAEEVAEAILFLASDAAGYVHGAVLSVDGGYTA